MRVARKSLRDMINKRVERYEYYSTITDTAGFKSINKGEAISIKGFVDTVKRQPFTDEIKINFFSADFVINRWLSIVIEGKSSYRIDIKKNIYQYELVLRRKQR